MRCTVVLFYTLLFHLVLEADMLAKKPRNSCTMQHLRRGRKGCVNLLGKIYVDEEKDKCTVDQLGQVERIDGVIIFSRGEYRDPMACFPSLTSIMIPEEPEFQNSSAIEIGYGVTNIERLSINSSLVIFSPNDKPWIKVHNLNSYHMDAKTYLFLSSRFGSKKLEIPRHDTEGHCFFKRPVIYMNDLNDCEIIQTDLILDGSLISSETRTKLRVVKGSVIIKNTRLDLNHIYFLRFVQVFGFQTDIKQNFQLSLTGAFAKALFNNHKNLSADSRQFKVEATLAENAHPDRRAGRCSFEDLAEEPEECTTIWGNVFMRKVHLKKFKKVTAIYGQLLLVGFDEESPFDAFPMLQQIISLSKEPAIVIEENTVLKKLSFPSNLTVHGGGQVLISIRNNMFFKLSHSEYKVLEDKYGFGRVSADVLGDKECFFPEAVSSLSQLDDCVYISGNLVFNQYTTGNTTTRIKYVAGCIHMNGTILSDLPFLENLDETSSTLCTTGHVIAHNKELCAAPWVEKLGRTRNENGYFRMVAIGNSNNCPYVCTREDVWVGNECTEVKEGLPVPIGMAREDTINHYFSENTGSFLRYSVAVRRVHGPISMRYSDLRDVNTFGTLENIDVNGDEPAINIEHNKDLEEVKFLHLENITSSNSSSILLRIRNNGKYKMPLKQYKKLVDKYGEERLDIDYEGDKEKKTSYYSGVILGVAGVAFIAIVAVIVIMSVALGFVAHGIRKERKAQRKKDKEKLEEEALLKKDEKEEGKLAKNEMTCGFGNGTLKISETGPNEPIGINMDDEEQGIPLGENASKSRLTPEVNGQLLNNTLHTPVSANNGIDGTQRKSVLATVRTATIKPGIAVSTNSSVMQKNKGVSDMGAVTARTVYLPGEKPFMGVQRNNVSVKKELPENVRSVTVKPAYLGGNTWTGGERNNVSVMGAKTAKTVMMGTGTMNGRKKDSVSVMAPKTAMTAAIGGNKWDGAARKKTSVGNLKTANVANLGGNNWNGGIKANVSTIGPRTAPTAMLGNNKSGWDGGKKTNASVVQAMTAKKAILGENQWNGGEKNNKSVVETQKSSIHEKRKTIPSKK